MFVGGLFLDNADRNVLAILRHLPSSTQPSAQVGGKAQ